MTAAPAFRPEDVLFYSPSEYLAPLDTGAKKVEQASKGDPEHSAQAIISVPPDADNRKQTIVTPPNIKLNHDVRLPNIVAWTPVAPAVPIAATEPLHSRIELPRLPSEVVAPAPQISAIGVRDAALPQQAAVAPAPEITTTAGLREPLMPRTRVVGPPPTIKAEMSRRLGEVDISPQQAVAPAPRLTIQAQRRLAAIEMRMGTVRVVAPAPELSEGIQDARSEMAIGQTRVVAPAPDVTELAALRGETLGRVKVVPPPPSTKGLPGKERRRRIIALNLNPLPPANPAEIPSGNRRGRFAATPTGRKGASGVPEAKPANGKENSRLDSAANAKDLPPGLHVSAPDSKQKAAISANGNGNRPGNGSESIKNGTLMASITPPRVGGEVHPAREVPEENASDTELRVFGGRPFYAMALNVPNLNSSGGSWVMHFAELNENIKGVLMAPEAIREVDPAYPLELMRHNIHGTVTLYAVIRSDGSVGDVRVLDGVDDRLDRYACQALEHWKFLPATKNGMAVPLAAVVQVPFRPVRSAF